MRELKLAESGFIAELDTEFKKVRRNFKDRGSCIRNVTKPAPTVFKEVIEHIDDSEIFMDDTVLFMETGEA